MSAVKLICIMWSFEEQFERALSLNDVSPKESIDIYSKIIKVEADGKEFDDSMIALKERSIYELAELHCRDGDVSSLQSMLVSLRPFFSKISKAKTGKIMRSLIGKIAQFAFAESNFKLLIVVTLDCIGWCKAENRIFLR